MPDTPSSSEMMPAGPGNQARRIPGEPDDVDRRATLVKVIKRRATVPWWLGIVLALCLAAFVTPAITAERWLVRFHAGTATEPGSVTEGHAAPFTVRAPMFAGYDRLRIGGGVVVARGEIANHDEATLSDRIARAMPRGPVLYIALFALIFVLAALFTHHMRRSIKGRLLRVQIVSLVVLTTLAVLVKIVMLSTALSALVVPVAVLALVPTMVLDRIVGLATGVLAALVVSFLAPFDVGLAILLLVQAATAGLVVAERPKQRWLAALCAGLVTTLCTSATYLLLTYLTTGHAPDLRDPLHSPWIAAAIGPALAAILAVPLIPIYQLLVGEITQGRLFALEDLGHPLLRQIAEKSPGTWQHSLMMANMAEIAANEIGASGRLVRVGAYFHDLGKSLSPKYFIENLEAGVTSPHDQLPPEVSCDAIFAHVTEGVISARKAGLHERIVDFMHMHHGNGVLEYFWEKCREQGNPHDLTIEDFRYSGHPPQSRETAILAICDAVEAASRTLKKPDAAAIDSLVQRIVYGKLHLGQLDESGLSMSDLRRISDSLRETIRHANHGRIEYPWQKAGQDASASVMSYPSTPPRLDSLDRKPGPDPAPPPSIPLPADSDAAFAATADLKDPPRNDRFPSAPHQGPAGPYEEDPPREPSPYEEGSAWGNPASEQRIPVANGVPPGTEPSNTVKIRAGTARNAHHSPPLGPVVPVVGDAVPRAPREASPGSERLDSGPKRSHPDAERRSSEPARGAGGTHDFGRVARAIERDAMPIIEAVPVPIREVPVTIPGRAPGPLPPPPDLITARAVGNEAPPAADTFDHEPPPAADTFDHEPPPAADTFDHELPPAAPTIGNEPPLAAHTIAAMLPPAPAHRLPTAPPLVTRRVPGEPARTAGPPTPVDLDNAITNPPPLRRGPSGHPPVPSDPAQLAAALASTVSRATAAPPGTPPPSEEAARTAGRYVDLDNAITNPPPLGSLAHTNASANPTPPGSPAPAPHTTAIVDSAITQPSMSSAPAPASMMVALASELDKPIANPPSVAVREGASPHKPSSQPLRTTGLADDDRQPRPMETLRGQGGADEPATIRRGTSTSDPLPKIRPGASTSDSSPTTRRRVSASDGRPATHPGDTNPDTPPMTRPGSSASDARPTIRPRGTTSDTSPTTRPGLSASEIRPAARPGSITSDTSPATRRGLSASEIRPAARPGSITSGTSPATRPGLSASEVRPAAHPGSITSDTSPATRPGLSGSEVRPAARLAALLLEDEARVTAARAATKPRDEGDARVTDEQRAMSELDLDAGVTEPSLPVLAIGDERRVDLALPAAPPASSHVERKTGWASGLAARIDAALDSDEWSHETPIVPPTKAELRALLGQPDPTRQQPVEEIALLQRRAAELSDAEAPRRSPHPTTEVDPDDIEAAIEIAPHVRRPTNANAIGWLKPKKSE